MKPVKPDGLEFDKPYLVRVNNEPYEWFVSEMCSDKEFGRYFDHTKAKIGISVYDSCITEIYDLTSPEQAFLLTDSDIVGLALHMVCDDPKSESIKRVTRGGMAYQLIVGRIVEQSNGDDE